MADARKQPPFERRTIRGDSPSQRPPPASVRPAVVSSSPPAAETSSPPPVVGVFDEAPTLARGTPALAARTDHVTLPGVAPPVNAAPEAVPTGPVFVAAAVSVRVPTQMRAVVREGVPTVTRPSPWRSVLVALAFVALVLVAAVAAKSALDARARAHALRRGGVGLDPAPLR